MGDLTTNFSIAEFWPADYGQCPPSQFGKVYYLCSTILQPLRDTFGPMTVTSGYRSAERNAAIAGSSKTSDHLWQGFSVCADVKFGTTLYGGIDTRVAAIHWLAKNAPFGFGQAIVYANKPHLHLSLPTPKHQSEILVLNDKTGKLANATAKRVADAGPAILTEHLRLLA